MARLIFNPPKNMGCKGLLWYLLSSKNCFFPFSKMQINYVTSKFPGYGVSAYIFLAKMIGSDTLQAQNLKSPRVYSPPFRMLCAVLAPSLPDFPWSMLPGLNVWTMTKDGHLWNQRKTNMESENTHLKLERGNASTYKHIYKLIKISYESIWFLRNTTVSTHRTLWTKNLSISSWADWNPKMPDFSGKIMKIWGNEMHCSIVVGHLQVPLSRKSVHKPVRSVLLLSNN